jgi:hypothetical protein
MMQASSRPHIAGRENQCESFTRCIASNASVTPDPVLLLTQPPPPVASVSPVPTLLFSLLVSLLQPISSLANPC